jgi:hypothetical protein
MIAEGEAKPYRMPDGVRPELAANSTSADRFSRSAFATMSPGKPRSFQGLKRVAFVQGLDRTRTIFTWDFVHWLALHGRKCLSVAGGKVPGSQTDGGDLLAKD